MSITIYVLIAFHLNCCWFTGDNRTDVCSKIINDDNKKEMEKENTNGEMDEMDKNVIFGGRNGERTSSTRANSFISINDEHLNVHQITQKVNGDTNVYSDDSEEGDDIDDESACDSFYSGTI